MSPTGSNAGPAISLQRRQRKGCATFVGRLLPSGLPPGLAVLMAILALMATAGTASAHLEYEMVLKVYITQGSTTTKEQAQAKQAGINDILKQCDKGGVSYRVTIVPVNSDSYGQNVTSADNEWLLESGERQVTGDGYAITTVNRYSGFIGGVWGDDVLGTTPSIAVSPTSTVKDGTGADTWAHEIGHGLGLDHPVPPDPTNLMNPAKTQPPGTKLTDGQCDTIRRNLPTRAKGTLDWWQRLTQTVEDALNWLLSDASGDAGYPPADLHSTMLVFDWRGDDKVSATIGVGLFPLESIDVDYYLGFDTDGNASTGLYLNQGTGATLGDYPGFERRAHIRVQGQEPFTVTAFLEGAQGGTWTQVAPLTADLSSRQLFIAVEEGEEPTPEKLGEELLLDIPMSDLGSLDSHPRVAALAVSTLAQAAEDEAPPETVDLDPTGPVLTLTPLVALPGDHIDISGAGFAASSDIDLVLGDVSLSPTTSGPGGAFVVDRAVPLLPLGNHLLDAIDEEGNVGVELLTVLGAVGGIAELPNVAQTPARKSGSSAGNYAALAGGLGATLLAISAGAWYTRRRWGRPGR